MSLPKNSTERKHQKIILMRRKPGRSDDPLTDEMDDDFSKTLPTWWEQLLFRGLNGLMVIFFIIATVKLQADDNACLWMPAFLIPAFLSSIVAISPALSGTLRNMTIQTMKS